MLTMLQKCLALCAASCALTLFATSDASAAVFTITDFGAVADDGLDDRAAVQAALDAACTAVAGGDTDVEVVVPAGVFDLEKGAEPAAGAPWVILSLGCGGFTLRGEPDAEPGGPSTLRLADAQGAFESLLGAPTFAQRVDGFTLRDLTFDGNGANNPITGGDDDLDDLLRERRHALRVYAGDDVRVESNRFTAWRTVNVVTLNGVGVADAVVSGNRFDALGQPPGVGPDWDHSAIYTDCDGAVIENNTFQTLGAGTFGVRAAIEVHGPNQVVARNRIDDFSGGINATGISVLGSDSVKIASNRMAGVADGIRIWAFEVAGNPPGEPVLRDASIRNNRIEIAVDPWRITQDAFEQASRGISLVGASDGVIENLEISGNTIIFGDFGNAPRDYDRGSAGIRLVPDLVPDLPIRGLTVNGNTLVNALAKGIDVGVALPDGASFIGNTILDAGVGPPSLTIFERSAFEFFGDYGDVDVLDTCVIDTDPAGPRLAQTLLLRPISTGGSRILDTAHELAGGSLTFLTTIGAIGSPWLIQTPTSICPRLFADGFELGDSSAWTATVP